MVLHECKKGKPRGLLVNAAHFIHTHTHTQLQLPRLNVSRAPPARFLQGVGMNPNIFCPRNPGSSRAEAAVQKAISGREIHWKFSAFQGQVLPNVRSTGWNGLCSSRYLATDHLQRRAGVYRSQGSVWRQLIFFAIWTGVKQREFAEVGLDLGFEGRSARHRLGPALSKHRRFVGNMNCCGADCTLLRFHTGFCRSSVISVVFTTCKDPYSSLKKSSDKFMYPLVLIDFDGLIEHRGCLGTPREIIWPSSSGLALGVGTAVVVIPRVCLCFGHSWFWDFWRVSWRHAVGCILNLSRSTSRSCLSQLPSQSSKLFQAYGKKGETRTYPQRWQPETKRRQKDPNMFFLFENWWAKCWYVGVVTPLQDMKKNYPTKSEFKELEVGMGSFKTRWLEPESSGWVGWLVANHILADRFDLWLIPIVNWSNERRCGS